MDKRKMTICRCEAVTMGEIVDTATTYNCSSREVKLRTRAGMGYCGGRTCRPLVEQLVQDVQNTSYTEKIEMSYRPPVRPVSFGDLGGDGDEKSD